MVKNPPANAGDMGSIPGPGRSYMPGATKPGAAKHRNYWTSALEPVSCSYWAGAPQLPKPSSLEPVLHQKRSCQMDKPEHHNEEKPPLTANRESPCRTKTQHGQNSIKPYILKKKKNGGEQFGNSSMDYILDDIMLYYWFFLGIVMRVAAMQEFIFRRCPLKYLQVK